MAACNKLSISHTDVARGQGSVDRDRLAQAALNKTFNYPSSNLTGEDRLTPLSPYAFYSSMLALSQTMYTHHDHCTSGLEASIGSLSSTPGLSQVDSVGDMASVFVS